MKSIFALLLAVIMTLSMAACMKKPETHLLDIAATETRADEQPPTPDPSPPETTPYDTPVVHNDSADTPLAAEGNEMININITVDGAVFSAILYDNDAARALLAQFPMTLNMSELNDNEKYYYLADNLPSAPTEKPEVINAGDIMCWSGNCLVLFYKTFSNAYGGYVPLGYAKDASGLAAALGSGGVSVTFAVEK